MHLIANRAGCSTESPDTQANELLAVVPTDTRSPETLSNKLTVVVPKEQPTTSTVTLSSHSATERDQELSMVDTPICTLVDSCKIDMVFEQLDNVIKSGNLDRQLDELAMANMIDVGGQPAFLEMLPALTVGPALYFIFFRLDQELQKLYEVHFYTKENEDVLLQSSYCVETVIFQLLSTITCFTCSNLSDCKSLSHALLFGTFRDKVTQKDVKKIEEILNDKFRTTSFYKENLLQPTESGKLVFTVDNMDGEELEISGIQRQIETIIEKSFKRTPLPVSWLVLRIILQSLKKPIVGIADCQIIAKRLYMVTPVEEVLWFLHHDTGILLYYQDIPSMKNVVICDPQVIYDCVSELIIETFKRGALNATLKEVDDFHDKGRFTLSSLREKTKDISSYLSLDQLIDILKYHNIIAAVNSTDEVDETKIEFIMFAVLQSASAEELQSQRKCHSEYRAGPLLIHFECGYVPYGVFCAEVTHLIAHQGGWLLCQENVKKNMATFCVDRAFHVTLMSHPQYLEVQISQQKLARTRKSLNEVCISVQETVICTLNTVITQMKYKPYGSPPISVHSPFKVAFPCCLEDHDNHLMTVKNDGKEWFAECIGGSHIEVDLSEEHLMWLANLGKSATCKRLKLDDSNLPEVEHHLLDLIEWKSDHKGKLKMVKVYLSSAHHWEKIACRLGIEYERIEDIRRQGVGHSEVEHHITKVFQCWLDDAINLPNASKYPKTWTGLIALLNDSNCGELASKLKDALQSPYSSARNTL